MKIGIIGSGNVGGTLGKAWSRLGHEVYFGFKDPNEPQAKALLTEAAASAKKGSVQDAAKFGEVIVLATPWDVTQEVLSSAGDLSGKILIDATNPLLPGPNRAFHRNDDVRRRKGRRVGKGCEGR